MELISLLILNIYIYLKLKNYVSRLPFKIRKLIVFIVETSIRLLMYFTIKIWNFHNDTQI